MIQAIEIRCPNLRPSFFENLVPAGHWSPGGNTFLVCGALINELKLETLENPSFANSSFEKSTFLKSEFLVHTGVESG